LKEKHHKEPDEIIDEPVAEEPELNETERSTAEAADLKDKLLRALAEFDNYKKRTAREREELVAFGMCEAVAALLPVLDNLSRAVEIGEDEAAKLGVPETKLLEGLKLVQKQFADTLQKLGVEEIPGEGEAFDPELHQAVMHVEDENYGANSVIAELLKGYKYKDRVIRHSVVKVAN